MAKRRGPGFGFRWDLFALVFGLLMISLGTAVGGYVTLGWEFELTSFDIWFIGGMISLAVAGILAGFNWLLTWSTPPIVTGNGVAPLSDVAPLEVASRGYLIDPKAVREETGKELPANVALDSMGRDAAGRSVPTIVLPGGGRRGYGIFIHPDGPFYIMKGEKPYMEVSDIHRGEFIIYPRVMIPLDPNSVEGPVIDVLTNKFSGFNKETAQYYLGGDWCAWFLEYVAYHWKDLDQAIHNRGFDPLKDSGIAEMDLPATRGAWLGTLSELNHEKLRRRYDQNTITAQAQIISGNALKQASVVSRRPIRGQEPVYQEADERRRNSGEQEFGR